MFEGKYSWQTLTSGFWSFKILFQGVMLFLLTRAVCFPGDLTLTICSCIMHQLISWWIIDSDWSEREECRRQSPYAFLVLKSKMSSSTTQNNSVQTLDSDWSTWPRTNEPHLKNKAVVRACWPLFSLKKAVYWIKHWNPGSFQMLHISSGELAKHKYLAQARRVWQTQNWPPWELWEWLLAMLFLIRMTRWQSKLPMFFKKIHLLNGDAFLLFLCFFVEESEVSNCKAIWSSKKSCLTI